MDNKKAISAVVATVLIILITVAAITIIWGAVIPMIRDNLGGELECSSATKDLTIVTEQGYTCYGDLDLQADNNDLSLQIRRGTEKFNLTDVDVLVTIGGQTTTYSWVNDLSGTLPGSNEERKIERNDISAGKIETVKIAPVIRIGNEEETCDPSNTVTLTLCS